MSRRRGQCCHPEKVRDTTFFCIEPTGHQCEHSYYIGLTELRRLVGEERRAALTEAAALFADPKRQQMILDLLGENLRYGCHCDLEDGQQPDACVFDNGDIEDCVYAVKLQRNGKGREDCEYWKPIRFALRDREPR